MSSSSIKSSIKYKSSRIKRFRILGKRAVSPLIATVLLIAFAVALGAVVMNWGSKYVDQTARDAGQKSSTDIKCVSEPSLEIYEINKNPKLCFNNKTNVIDFVVQNTGSIKVEGIQLNILGNKTQKFVEINSSVNIGRFQKFNITYDKTTYGEVDSIEFQPKIKVGGKDILCVKSSLVKTDVPLCK